MASIEGLPPSSPSVFDNEMYIASRFLRFVVTIRQYWQGDLDRWLISLCFLVLNHSPPNIRNNSDGGGRALSIQSIADMTGIPRESVRRKVDVMLKMGDLKLGEDGSLTLGEMPDRLDVIQEIITYFDRIA